MRLIDLKNKLNELSEKQLNAEVIIITDDTSELVSFAGKLKHNYYAAHWNDPPGLFTKKELRDNGVINEEIDDSYSLVIEKGDFIIDCRE